MDEDTYTRLRERSAEIAKAIYAAAGSQRMTPSEACYSVAQNVAARLYLINVYLGSLPPYWIEPDVGDLCHSLLKDLLGITTPPKGLSGSLLFRHLGRFSQPSSGANPPDLETSLLKFFRAQHTTAQKLMSTCDELLAKLARDDAENDAQEVPQSALKKLNCGADMSEYFNGGVFDALQLISKCNPKFHKNVVGDPWHPARLCLDETEVGIRVLVSPTTETGDWQEFCVRTQPESLGDEYLPLPEQGGFCDILEKQITARVSLSFIKGRGFTIVGEAQQPQQILPAGREESLATVLRKYDLKPKDKVLLASAVARAYWQYYDSDMMRTRWTSDTIWFIPEEKGGAQRDQLPLCAYLSFPFGSSDGSSKDIFLDLFLTHRYPRILDVGVLLLEIGLGEKCPTGNKRDLVAQLNTNHMIATKTLERLEKATWDGFLNKKVFDRAVKFCLDGKNFIKAPKKPKTSRLGPANPPKPMTVEEQKKGVIERRRIFFQHVVQPLAWLAREGFKAQPGLITYVSEKRPEPQLGPTDPAQQPDGECLFHAEIVPKMWLEDIKKISASVERKRRAQRIKDPVRVAILDTGLNTDLPIFEKKPSLKHAVKDCIDFVDGASAMTDTFGHGTLMARIVMECAPGAEILVARVARNSKELKTSRENIRKAILWAGQPGKADIIFTSFGVSREDEGGIGEAIEAVERERGEDIIFFASAGNSDTDDESFPACHASVVAVYATDKHGVPLSSNAAAPGQKACVLGTYGEPPDSLRAEFATTPYPGICEAGSSIATAAMAGIGAAMLAYAAVLPSLEERPCNHVLKRLRTSRGMEELLFRLAPEAKAHPWLRAVKPPVFWKNKPNDSIRHCVFIDALSDVERLYPRRPRGPAKKI
ncbi:hypothetical protein MAPG_10820 [Magnaporthiopsis poae ATCC 64411]|uniref:Uncharacterized protein n=1 Tax=Magnaporthiopsis poae (strain ATCC 64411 / 73-15) TaxID=644358 RepID=A0A0C4EDL6_MAGP6|nr:hypothetical protein MAPG_10820 [Magnaporthiopsis poae ATCC 64411]